MSSDRYYIVYDGRAMYDVDRASVLESLGHHRDLNAAMREAKRGWGKQGAVLVSYQDDGANLTDEQVHGEVS